MIRTSRDTLQAFVDAAESDAGLAFPAWLIVSGSVVAGQLVGTRRFWQEFQERILINGQYVFSETGLDNGAPLKDTVCLIDVTLFVRSDGFVMPFFLTDIARIDGWGFGAPPQKPPQETDIFGA